jgi:hypothetical protein
MPAFGTISWPPQHPAPESTESIALDLIGAGYMSFGGGGPTVMDAQVSRKPTPPAPEWEESPRGAPTAPEQSWEDPGKGNTYLDPRGLNCGMPLDPGDSDVDEEYVAEAEEEDPDDEDVLSSDFSDDAEALRMKEVRKMALPASIMGKLEEFKAQWLQSAGDNLKESSIMAYMSDSCMIFRQLRWLFEKNKLREHLSDFTWESVRDLLVNDPTILDRMNGRRRAKKSHVWARLLAFMKGLPVPGPSDAPIAPHCRRAGGGRAGAVKPEEDGDDLSAWVEGRRLMFQRYLTERVGLAPLTAKVYSVKFRPMMTKIAEMIEQVRGWGDWSTLGSYGWRARIPSVTDDDDDDDDDDDNRLGASSSAEF